MDINFIPIQNLNIELKEIIRIYSQLTNCPKISNEEIRKIIKI